MMSLSDDKQADVIDALNTTSRYLDDIFNINNVNFDNMVSQIYPSDLQLNKDNTSNAKNITRYKTNIRTQHLIKMNTGAKEIQQVNPGWPDNSQSIRPLPSYQ